MAQAEVLNQTLLAKQVLQETFGYQQFRPGQETIIDTALGGRDCLVVMPTGGGKSLCYQVPALVLGGLGLWHDDWQALQLGELSMQGWLWLAYLVLPVSLGVYPAYFWLLREVKPSLVSTFAFVNPVVALLLGYLILDERLSLSAGMACAAVLVGVSMIIFGRR